MICLLVEGWKEVESFFLRKLWLKIICHEDGANIKARTEDNVILHQFITSVWGCESVTKRDVKECLKSDNLEEELTDKKLIKAICKWRKLEKEKYVTSWLETWLNFKTYNYKNNSIFL